MSTGTVRKHKTHPWLISALLIILLSACGTVTTPRPQPVLTYSLPGGGRCVTLGAHPQQPYANIKTTDDLYQAHSESMIAEDPNNPLHLVGGAKFFPDIARYRFQVGYVTSLDGGCTWHDGGVLPGFSTDISTSDPGFAFGPRHEVYASVLFYSLARQKSGIAVFTSTDNGSTFGPPVFVFNKKPSDVFSDKPWMTVDQTDGPHSGNVYVVWAYDHGGDCGDGNLCQQNLAFSRSTDHGKTFSAPRMIEGNASFCRNPVRGRPANATRCDATQGAIPVVQPDGTIFVATPYIDLANGNIPTRLFVVSSHDGGVTWKLPVLIATIDDVIGGFPPEHYRNISLPAFARDPKTGQLYITWSNRIAKGTEILFSASKDNGQSWSAPLRVNDGTPNDGTYHFQPQMAVASGGVVSITFFDTRRDPQHKRIDVYLAQSIDHGKTFLANRRVTTENWEPSVKAPKDDSGSQFIGDYQGLAADNLFVHPLWNDTRTGQQELFTAAIPSAQP